MSNETTSGPRSSGVLLQDERTHKPLKKMKTGFYLLLTDMFISVLIFAVIKLDRVEVKGISWN